MASKRAIPRHRGTASYLIASFFVSLPAFLGRVNFRTPFAIVTIVKISI
ncbi:MAG: hypothetical protein ABIH03_13455 [Pseudomonadota bacterium]